jgi:hypothetical protein
MKKIIREIKEQGIVQITIADERWYQKGELFVPSVTWITGHYPKGIAFYKWLADKSWDEAEAIKAAAGDKGSKVHNAIMDLIAGKKIDMDSKYLNPSSGETEELTLEEYECLMSFAEWFNANKPKVLHNEVVVFNEKEGYAGTVDLICKIGKEYWLIDFKTSQNVWPEYELQVSAYKHALKNKKIKLAILQLGYRRNKSSYKFTEIEDKFDLFLAAKQIWANECANVEPKKKDYPSSLLLNLKVGEKKTKRTKKQKNAVSNR